MDTDPYQEQPGVAPTLSFASKDSNKLRAMRELTLRHVTSVLAMFPQDTAILLRYFSRNKEALTEQYLMNQETVLTDAGLQIVAASSSGVTSLECENCRDDERGLETFHLACDHLLYRECYSRYLSDKVEHGDLSTFQCPHEGCRAAVGEMLLRYMVSDAVYTSCCVEVTEGLPRYLSRLDDTYVKGNPNLKWCASPDCH
ncbi:hypothetical protein MBANPS3_002973 [Mucor bainieri]